MGSRPMMGGGDFGMGGGYGGPSPRGGGPGRFESPMPREEMSDGSGFGKENSVIMVYGLAEKFNCDRLFNICCLYGNVVRVMNL